MVTAACCSLILPSVYDISINGPINYKMLQQYSSQYYISRNLTEPLDRILATNGLHYVDLFSDFVTDGKSPYYFSGLDNHWNDLGQEKAAEIVAADPRPGEAARAAERVAAPLSCRLAGTRAARFVWASCAPPLGGRERR